MSAVSWQLLLAARSLSRNSQSRTRSAFNASRPTPRSISSFPSLSPCIPPSYPSSYRIPLPNSTNASYAPSRRQRQCLAPTPSLQHPHLCDPPHTFFIDGRGLSPFSLPSLGACHWCLPSLTVGVSKIEICDHSNTKMSTPLPTTKVTDETNDLAYTHTNTNTNLNSHSMVDDSSQNARCLSLSRYCSTTQHRLVEVSSVGCLDFGLDTTAGVDVDVEPVSERMPRFRLNTSSPSPAPHVQTLSDDSSFTLP